MNILLVNPSFLRNNIRPPLGLAYLAAALEKENRVKILDLSLYEQGKLIEVLQVYRPDVVGVTCYTPSFSSTNRVVDEVKSFDKKIITVVGGAHATAMPETLLANKNVDYVIRGEGEKTFPELVECIRDNLLLSIVKGLSCRLDDSRGTIIHNPPRPYIENIDSIPLPARNYLELDKYIDFNENRRLTTLITSRGCPFICIYCCKSVVGKRWVAASAERVMEEISEIVNRYGFKSVNFHDELFTLDKQRIVDICDMIIEAKMDLTWSCNTRVDMVDRKLLEIMKRAGCNHISYGVESGDEKVLKSIKKGITITKVREIFELTKKAGIDTSGYFMLGLPEDTMETMQKTIDLAIELSPRYLQFSIATPFPGTEMYDVMEREELLVGDYKYDDLLILNNKPLFDMKYVTKEQIYDTYLKAMKRWQRHVIMKDLRERPLDLAVRLAKKLMVNKNRYWIDR